MANEQREGAPAEKPRANGRLGPILIVAVLMGAEGIGVFFLAKSLGSDPAPALGAGYKNVGEEGAGQDSAYAEVELADCRPTNTLSGRFISFHIRVSALVSSADRERVEQLAQDNQARLEDGANTVIRGAEPKYFDEPRLDTIRRRLRHEFGKIFQQMPEHGIAFSGFAEVDFRIETDIAEDAPQLGFIGFFNMFQGLINFLANISRVSMPVEIIEG